MSVEVENVLKVRDDGLLAEFVVVEGMSEEMVKLGLEVQKVLGKRERKKHLITSIHPSQHELLQVRTPGFAPQGSGPFPPG